MGLNVKLLSDKKERHSCYACNQDYYENIELYSGETTHNLTEMAKEAGLYEVLWRPYRLLGIEDEDEDEYLLVIRAKFLIPLLEIGLKKLESDPDYYHTFNSENGWGLYEHFVPFVRNYLEACKENPSAKVEVCR